MAAAYSKHSIARQGDSLTFPPSYDAVMHIASREGAGVSSASSFNTTGKQFGGFSEKEQHKREQELFSSRDVQSSSGHSSAYSSPAATSSAQSGMSLDAKTALARFGSPFATSPDWSPSPHDAQLMHLPQLDLDLRVKMRFSGPSSEQRALAPPPSFSRQVRPSPVTNFEPIFIRSASSKPAKKQLLSDGFQPVYPGRLMVPRDVSAADWGRFLEDLVVAGRLTGKQSIISNVAPITMHLGATGFFVTRAIENGMKKRKDPLILEVVETYQQSFFTPRNLDVYVLRNGERLTARSPNAPIPASNYPIPSQLQRSNTSSSSGSSSSSSSSDSSDDETHLQTMNGQRLDRRQRKMLRKERKAERKLRRAEHKHERKMAKLERKHGKALRRDGDVMTLPPAPQSASNSASPVQTRVPRHSGARGGYMLVIAPLSTAPIAPSGDAAAFMW